MDYFYLATMLSWISAAMRLLYGRLLIAAIIGTLFIGIMFAVRKNLSPQVRSWCWCACFLALFLPLERGLIILLGDSLARINNNIFYTGMAAPFVVRNIFGIVLLLLFLIWFTGSVVLVFKTRAEFKKARLAIAEKKLPLCASYFHHFRSHIYKPLDFETAFTQEEQAMMLAHENQHIAQHDPLLFRLLAIAECVFWFCPPIHMAAKLFRHDRELLCDERTSSRYIKRDYCMMLLKASEKRLDGRQLAGIVSEPYGVSERIETIITPISANAGRSVVAICVAVALFALGLPGFAPISGINAGGDISAGQTVVCLVENRAISLFDIPHIEGMERFVSVREDGIDIDEKGMYEFALSIGLGPEQRLYMLYLLETRPCLGEAVLFSQDKEFTVSQLQTESVFMPFNHSVNKFVDLAFRMI